MSKAMKKLAATTLKRVLKTVVYGIIGAFLMLLSVGIYMLNQKADLKIWHTADLDEEYTASSPVRSFAEYLALEERLFAELDEKVYQKINQEDKQEINRYFRGSLSDPERWKPNWNRSFELAIDGSDSPPKAGVLLIHGLSDSPYSLRNIGQQLHAKGAHVVGLRVPGHGTAPVGLTRTRWQDMAAAVEIAMRHLAEKAAGQPLFVIGYSNGGALAVHYALSTLENSELPKLDGTVLISPEIGISPAAALAIWQERIGRVLGLKKLGWTGVSPEYDPFKYASFPVNAGNLAYELTGVNRKKISRLSAENRLGDLPPVLAFQSVVDATVSAQALVQDLFQHLPDGGHELFVFGLNRMAEMEPLLKGDPGKQLADILEGSGRSFDLSLLTNSSSNSSEAIVRTWKPGQTQPTETDTGLIWPENIYSLAHVALPFSGKDPVYGGDQPDKSPGIHLGNLALRGEKGAIKIPAGDMLRLRWNPFYPYLEQRALQHLGLDAPVAPIGR